MDKKSIEQEVTEELRKEFARPFEVRHIPEGRRVHTSDQYFGWVATLDNYDGPGSPIGMGRTEVEAVQQLADFLDDKEDFYGLQACNRWLMCKDYNASEGE